MPISDYYRGLREKLGTELLMVPSVAAVIRNEEREILFLRKGGETLWALPAGAIEPGETPPRTLRREVFEETGLMVNPVRILGVFGGEKFRYIYQSRDHVEYVFTVYECSIVKGNLRSEDGEAEELRFFRDQELPEFTIPYPLEIFRQFDDTLNPVIYE
ncbi:NUDIX domain-containing protein [Paenibacillus sp. sgz500958]|uniref:NUDIX domain-containing protein n=1 Tax=Paenibacillus sp. sgz500958 TaxID=3242475 RepID=UPI0036D407F4